MVEERAEDEKAASAKRTLERARSLQQAKDNAKPKPPKPEKEPLSKRAKRGITIVIALVICCVVLAFSGSGSVSLSVLSATGATDNAQVRVSVYKGDVSETLADNDASNDPEPLQSAEIPVGQRVTFYMQDFGSHTIYVHYLDENIGYADPDPLLVNMFWIDWRQTIETA